jgi:hypothetical protein
MLLVFLFVIRGTLMVAVTEFVAGSSSCRDASKFGFGGGESVKVAEIFCSSSFSSTLARRDFLSGELIV